MLADDSRELIWKIYADLGTTERHFNDLQARYRALASTWLLAAFGGIGYVLTSQLAFGAVTPALAVAFVASAAAAGLYLLWLLDVQVYHRLLDAAFVEGLRLEERHEWLPQVRLNMMRVQEQRGVLGRVRVFYVAGFGLMALVAAGALGVWTRAEAVGSGWVAVAAMGAGAVALGVQMLRRTHDTGTVRERVGR